MASVPKLNPNFVLNMLTAVLECLETPQRSGSSFFHTMENLFPVTTPDVARALLTTKPAPNNRFNQLDVLAILTGDATLVPDLTMLVKGMDDYSLECRIRFDKEHKSEMWMEYRRSPTGVPLSRCFLPSVGIAFGFEWTSGVPLLEAAQIKESAELVILEQPGDMWRLKTVFTGNTPLTLKPQDSIWAASAPATVEDSESSEDGEYDRIEVFGGRPHSRNVAICKFPKSRLRKSN